MYIMHFKDFDFFSNIRGVCSDLVGIKPPSSLPIMISEHSFRLYCLSIINMDVFIKIINCFFRSH